MKKTYTINLSGKIFHIDDDALDKLQEYLNALKTYYSKEDDGPEIMDDIENRIGELFSEYMKNEYREVVTSNDVAQAISTMGTPDDIIDDDNDTPRNTKKQVKKLYRGNSCLLGHITLVTSDMFYYHDSLLRDLLDRVHHLMDCRTQGKNSQTKTGNERRKHKCLQHRTLNQRRISRHQK